ncbi:MAG: hypothetical protein PUC50_09580 [Bacteroidales bacterium]|nr:hypothetical protein [Bacteroidales bacterium]
MKLTIKFEKCFGIKHFEQPFNFTNGKNCVLIYAPNGTMKSSFAKTMLYLSKRDLPESKRPQKPCDLLDESITASYEAKFDGIDILPENIYVMNGDDEIKDSSEKISTMLASSDLKQEYDRIYQSLDAERKEFIRILKDVSQSSDCEDELVNAFKRYESDNLFTVLNRIKTNIQQPYPNFGFRYNFIFDKKGNVKKFLEKNQNLLNEYISRYNKLIRESDFFCNDKRGSFGTYQAEQILTALGGDGFFHAHHKLSLSIQSDINEITSKEQLETIYNQELEKIATDNDLKKSLKKLNKAIEANEELRYFKETITQNPHLIPYLNDYEKFRKETWYGYLHSILDKVTSLMDSYEHKKAELLEIRRKAKEEIKTWKEIIKLYNDRFFVPFEAVLENQDDVVLKGKTPVVKFKYANDNSYEKEQIMKVLSKGEQRALIILQFLFEIECRKNREPKQLIVLDDISDSFDYKNKYAIIEYIKDINEKYSNLKIIILTHNYDFYRTVHSRLYPEPITLMTLKDDNNKITLKPGRYVKSVFNKVMIDGVKKGKDEVFVSIIPWVRNIVEYTQSDSSSDFKKLTSCLHIKSDTSTTLVKDVYRIISNNVEQCKDVETYSTDTTPIKDFIYQVADGLESKRNLDEIALENKTVFAMAIRLKLEEKMISLLTGYESEINAITENQTAELIKILKEHKQRDYNNMKSIIEKINMMTPENIHVNSFMFEPLIDLSVVHLKQLYSDVKVL